MPRIYDNANNYSRPRKCDCDKIPYRDEGAALAAAERLGAEFETEFRAYRCTGTRVWHLASRGFHPRSLRSDARVLAWHVSVQRSVDRAWLLEQFGVGPDREAWSNPERNKAKKVSAILRAFANFGLVELSAPSPDHVTALDQAGLLRVMAVGLQEYERKKRRTASRTT